MVYVKQVYTFKFPKPQDTKSTQLRNQMIIQIPCFIQENAFVLFPVLYSTYYLIRFEEPKCSR